MESFEQRDWREHQNIIDLSNIPTISPKQNEFFLSMLNKLSGAHIIDWINHIGRIVKHMLPVMSTFAPSPRRSLTSERKVRGNLFVCHTFSIKAAVEQPPPSPWKNSHRHGILDTVASFKSWECILATIFIKFRPQFIGSQVEVLPSEWKFQGATMSSMKPKKTTSVMTKPESEPELSPSQPEKTTMKSNLRKPSPPPHPRIQLLHQLHRQVDLPHQGTANTK